MNNYTKNAQNLEIFIKNFNFFLFFFIAIFFSNFKNTFAQKKISEQELKSLKSELKQFKKNPLAFLQFKQKLDSTQKYYQKLDSINKFITDNKIQSTKENFDKYAFLLEKKDKIIDSLNEEITKTKYLWKHYQTKVNFQIQISTTEKQLNQMWLSREFVARKTENRRFMYFFGNFSSYWEAKTLANFMRKGGFDGYVVGWEGATRISNLAGFSD